MNKNAVHQIAIQTLDDVNQSIASLKEFADKQSIPVDQIRSSNGALLLAPLLQTKASLLSTIAITARV